MALKENLAASAESSDLTKLCGIIADVSNVAGVRDIIG